MSTDFFFIKTRPVKSPVRGTSESAGIDFFVPDDFEQITVGPGTSVLIPSGIKCAYPPGHALILFNKSGIATKYKLTSLACVCDSDYQGEIHISLINIGNDEVTISPGMKIAQFILVPVETPQPEEVASEEDLWSIWRRGRSVEGSERGEGGFGSTGEF
jgi:dUTP pyrophosphatase